MKPRLRLTTALLVFWAGSGAHAAELPVPAPVVIEPVTPRGVVIEPVFSWSGLYVGVSGGAHWDTDRITAIANPAGFVPFGVNPSVFDSAFVTSLNPRGFIGGGQIGYNWQSSNIVFGLEFDANGLSGNAQRTVTGAPLIASGLLPGDFVADSTKGTFLATMRGRAGTTIDRAFLYATGGVTWGIVKTTDTFAVLGGALISSTNNTTNTFGWTLGGGVEYAATHNWSFKVEYLFVDLGNFNQTIPAIPGAPNTTITINHAYTENIARVGVNYRFYGPVVANY
jgi:outer membrane immunogenic protein